MSSLLNQKLILKKQLEQSFLREGKFRELPKLLESYLNKDFSNSLGLLYVFQPQIKEKVNGWDFNKFSKTLYLDSENLKLSSSQLSEEIEKGIQYLQKEIEIMENRVKSLSVDSTSSKTSLELKNNWADYVDFTNSNLFIDSQSNTLKNEEWLRVTNIPLSNITTYLNKNKQSSNQFIISTITGEGVNLKVESPVEFNFIKVSTSVDVVIQTSTGNIFKGKDNTIKLSKSVTSLEFTVKSKNSDIETFVFQLGSVGILQKEEFNFKLTTKEITLPRQASKFKVSVDTKSNVKLSISKDSTLSELENGKSKNLDSFAILENNFNSSQLVNTSNNQIKSLSETPEGVMKIEQGVNQFYCKSNKGAISLGFGYSNVRTLNINTSQRYLKGNLDSSLLNIISTREGSLFQRASTYGNESELCVLVFGGEDNTKYLQMDHEYSFKTYLYSNAVFSITDCILNSVQGYRKLGIDPISGEEAYCSYEVYFNNELILKNNKVSTLYEDNTITENLNKFTLNVQVGFNVFEIRVKVKNIEVEVTKATRDNFFIPDKPYYHISVFPSILNSTLKSSGITSVKGDLDLEEVNYAEITYTDKKSCFSRGNNSILIKVPETNIDNNFQGDAINYRITKKANSGSDSFVLNVTSEDPDIEIKGIEINAE